jgi:hypothetical protein
VYAGPVRLDTGTDSTVTSLGAWSGTNRPPKVAKAVAIAEGCFRSRVATIEAPLALDPPRVNYSGHTGTLTMESPAPSGTVDIRFTLDGSAPTFTSPLYTRPIALPKGDATHRRIRAACFPQLRFPSVETVAEMGVTVDTRAPFLTNKSAMSRVAAAHSRQEDDDGPALLMAPGSRGTASRYKATASPSRDQGTLSGRSSPIRASSTPTQTQRRGGTPSRRPADRPTTPRRGSSPSKPVAAASHTPSRKPSARATTTITRQSPASQTGAAKEPTPAAADAAAPPPKNVSCAAEENTVNFAFEAPIALSHITVATPGSGRGPAMYELYARVQGDPPDSAMQLVGGGALDDFEGVQTLPVKPAARLQPIVQVRCVFLAGASAPDSLFQINDLKVHGKTFKR